MQAHGKLHKSKPAGEQANKKGRERSVRIERESDAGRSLLKILPLPTGNPKHNYCREAESLQGHESDPPHPDQAHLSVDQSLLHDPCLIQARRMRKPPLGPSSKNSARLPSRRRAHDVFLNEFFHSAFCLDQRLNGRDPLIPR